MTYQSQPFHRVLREELNDIRKRRRDTQEVASEPMRTSHDQEKTGGSLSVEDQSAEEAKERQAQRVALEMDMAGLALSGGGIRSATFALGVLQGLASFGLVRRFDYLSTVSGGGYIGSWLVAWIKREGDITNVERQLNPSHAKQAEGRLRHPETVFDEEPEPICHLRAYSSYLAPHRGLFSADSWVLVAIYLRNIFLNQLVLLPSCAAILLGARLLESFYDWDGGSPWSRILLRVMFLALIIGLLCIFLRFVLASTVLRAQANKKIPVQVGVNLFHILILFPLFLFAVLASWDLGWDLVRKKSQPNYVMAPAKQPRGLVSAALARDDSRDTPWWEELEEAEYWPLPHLKSLREWERRNDKDATPHLSRTMLFGAIFGTCVFLIYLALRVVLLVGRLIWSRELTPAAWRGWPKSVVRSLGVLASSFLAGFTGGVLLYAVFAFVFKGAYWQPYDVALVAAVGPPLAVMVLAASICVAVGLLGTMQQEDEREWWASLCGWLLIYATVWLGVIGISFFGPLALVMAPTWGKALLGTGWSATALAGILAGKSPRTGAGRSSQPMELVALVAPPVFLVGLLAIVTLLIDWTQSNVPESSAEEIGYYFSQRLDVRGSVIFFTALGLAAFACLLAWRIDVNTFSLNGLYGDRLVRCFLGASRPKEREEIDRRSGASANSNAPVRQPDPITGFDPDDDLPLRRLRIGEDHCAKDQPYWGPYLVVNTAMNLVQGDELAWQERKAESFVLTPQCCGSRTTGYGLLDQSNLNPLRLGTAIALSGAAVSPNMGYHSSPAVTALLTVFNVRLGGWFVNPRYGEPRNSGPTLGLLYLLKELFGRTNSRSGYVYLSDGGHFDNLGVYELVRRRCRYVVACDAEEDASYAFGALSSVIQKCYTDFGVSIEIDVSPLRPQGPERSSRWHCAVGQIRYDQVDPAAKAGVLVYVKASLTGDEPPDVQNYAQLHLSFPHQTTADQFFNESQFESYRALGCHIACNVFCGAMQGVDNAYDLSDAAHRGVVNQLFSNLHASWPEPTAPGSPGAS